MAFEFGAGLLMISILTCSSVYSCTNAGFWYFMITNYALAFAQSIVGALCRSLEFVNRLPAETRSGCDSVLSYLCSAAAFMIVCYAFPSQASYESAAPLICAALALGLVRWILELKFIYTPEANRS